MSDRDVISDEAWAFIAPLLPSSHGRRGGQWREHVATLGPGERDRVLDAVERLCRSHPDLAGRATFELPYLTHAYRARRAR